jgi:hypothetical protein
MGKEGLLMQSTEMLKNLRKLEHCWTWGSLSLQMFT